MNTPTPEAVREAVFIASEWLKDKAACKPYIVSIGSEVVQTLLSALAAETEKSKRISNERYEAISEIAKLDPEAALALFRKIK